MKLFYSSLFSTLSVLAATVCAQAAPIESPATARSGPGYAWPVVAQIPAGTDVEILTCGQGWRHLWCQVEYEGGRGFVKSADLAPVGSGASGKVMVASVITTDLANLRTGPGVNWPVAAVIPAEETVNVLQCNKGWLSGWCKVAYEGETGWVNAGLLARQDVYR